VGPVNRADHVEPFLNDVSKLLATHLISVRVSPFKGVPFLGDVRIIEHIANLGAITTHGLVSDQSTSAFPDSSARFRRRVTIFDFNQNAVLEKAAAALGA
jgi:hypothetical protein